MEAIECPFNPADLSYGMCEAREGVKLRRLLFLVFIVLFLILVLVLLWPARQHVPREKVVEHPRSEKV